MIWIWLHQQNFAHAFAKFFFCLRHLASMTTKTYLIDPKILQINLCGDTFCIQTVILYSD